MLAQEEFTSLGMHKIIFCLFNLAFAKLVCFEYGANFEVTILLFHCNLPGNVSFSYKHLIMSLFLYVSFFFVYFIPYLYLEPDRQIRTNVRAYTNLKNCYTFMIGIMLLCNLITVATQPETY